MSRYPKISKEKYSPKDYINMDVDIIKKRLKIIENLEVIQQRINRIFSLTQNLSKMSKSRRDKFFNKLKEKVVKND